MGHAERGLPTEEVLQLHYLMLKTFKFYSLWLSFFICKMGKKNGINSNMVVQKAKYVTIWEVLEQNLANSNR